MRVGILGGGQLAKMLALAGQNLGLEVFVLGKKGDCASRVLDNDHFLIDSASSLKWIFENCEKVTFESEFWNLERIPLKGYQKIFPDIKSIAIAKNKLNQKNFFSQKFIPTQKYAEIKSHLDFSVIAEEFGVPFVIKKAEMGYDGKGTYIVKSKVEFEKLIKDLGNQQIYVEEFAKFSKELSVIVARSKFGQVRFFDVTETYQEKGVCLWTSTPAEVTGDIAQRCRDVARKVVSKINGVGVFGVEMFLLVNGKIVVNEIAPRVHNSGHWTMDGCNISQFYQHWISGLGLKMVSPKMKYNSIQMYNILGRLDLNLKKENDPIQNHFNIAGNAKVYWYGKIGHARGRKLGHINICGWSKAEGLKLASKVRRQIEV